MTEHLLHMCEELVSVPSFLLELMVLSKQMMKIKGGKYYGVEQLTSSVNDIAHATT